jgi:hypothetical protein
MGLAVVGVESVGMARDIAEQVPGVGSNPGVLRDRHDGALAQRPRLGESAEQSSSSIEPFRSANRTVTCLRSPSSAAFEVRIFSARCLGV